MAMHPELKELEDHLLRLANLAMADVRGAPLPVEVWKDHYGCIFAVWKRGDEERLFRACLVGSLPPLYTVKLIAHSLEGNRLYPKDAVFLVAEKWLLEFRPFDEFGIAGWTGGGGEHPQPVTVGADAVVHRLLNSALDERNASSTGHLLAVGCQVGRPGSMVEIVRLKDKGFTFELKELAEWYRLELSRIAVDECLRHGEVLAT